jgi:hypothetical protein
MRMISLLIVMVTSAAWIIVTCLLFHDYIWNWDENGNKSNYLREMSNNNVINEGGASMQDRAFIDSTEDTKATAAKTPVRRNLVESFVISFDDDDNVEKFKQRNNHSGLGDVLWVPAVDGHSQRTLDLWARLTGTEVMNATSYTRGNESQKVYQSPHSMGCYLAHYHLLQFLRHHPHALQPSLYFVFEDDASCVPNLVDETHKVTQKLPPDWDLFFIGGKPFTYFTKNFTLYEDSSNETLERDVCLGAFGKGIGPLSPDGSRPISEQDDYWQAKYLTNTHAYVINPNQVHHVVEILKPIDDVPIDIRLADSMDQGRLNVYMPTQEWCRTGIESPWKNEKPVPWYGYLGFVGEAAKHPFLQERYYLWEAMANDNCSY